jgi:UDP-2,3-diacylglucosamine hydrolase
VRDEPEVLGLIAGQGVFPLDVARAARRAGRRVACVAFREHTDPGVALEVERLTWVHPGEVATAVAALRDAGVRELVMVGKVPKIDLIGNPDALRLDATAVRHLGGLADRRDDTILARAAELLEQLGFRLLPQWALAPELLAGEGPLGKVSLTPAGAADVAFGFPIAKTMGGLDIGQTVVVKDRAVIAVEAIEGTDETIRRAGALAPGTCVIKVAKPRQDPRFDVPTIGRATIGVAARARVAVVAFEAGATVVLQREELVREADAHGIAVVGVDPGRFQELAP